MQNLFETIFLLAGIQGVLLSVLLFTWKRNHSANIVLGIAVLTLSMNLFSNYYYSTGLFRKFPWYMGVTYPFPYLYGPLFYIYAKLVSKKEEKFRMTNLFHFLPAILVYASVADVFFYTNEDKIKFVENLIIDNQPLLFSIIENLIPFVGIFYTVLTYRVTSEYNRKIKNSFSNIDTINLYWLWYITIGTIAIWSIVALIFFIDLLIIPADDINWMLHLSISILIYSVGYMGLKQPEIFTPHITDNIDASEQAKYKKSGLTEQDAEEIKCRLIELMDNEKHYLDSELTLSKLAGLLDVSPHNLSEVINSKLNQTYYDFINNYRVEEFKKRLLDPENQKYNLLSIAFDSGFKSKATFNTIFKKFTGLTPSEYRNTASQKKVL